MQATLNVKKTKISLSDYPFAKDIENRLLMAEFSVFDVQLLEEILDGSLNTYVSDLADALEAREEDTLASLEKFSKTGLLKVVGPKVSIDKEMRKYFESQISKFDPKFTAGIDYIRSLLKKVPIDVLPTWYQLPRTSDDIFESIIEKFLVTPKVFFRHLEDVTHEIPIFSALWQDLLKAKDFTIPAKDLYTKYNLSREYFEELMLLLEFNFACCISYKKEDDKWIEVVSPFAEWKKYLSFLNETKIEHSLDDKKVQKPSNRSFIGEMSTLLKQLKVKPISMNALEKTLTDRLLQLRLVESKGSFLHPLDVIDSFLSMNEDQKSHLLHRTSILANEETSPFYIEKHLREIEKNLSNFTKTGWIFFDDFIKACTACIGTQQEITLKKVGKNWEYFLPKYTEQEIAFIREMIFERLNEAGTTDVGLFDDRPCFQVTAFGHKILSRD